MSTPRPHRVSLGIAGLASGLVALSALGGLAVSLLTGGKPIWFAFAFEAVVGIATILGVLTARGRFGEGRAMALACIAGTVAVGSLLAFQSLRLATDAAHLMPVMLARVGAAGVMGAVAVWLGIQPRWQGALPRLALGAALAVAAVGGAGLAIVRRAQIADLGEALSTVAALTIFAVATALLSAAVHIIVRAFENASAADGPGGRV